MKARFAFALAAAGSLSAPAFAEEATGTWLSQSGETRIRIYKTYTDAPSYYETAAGFVFDRPLGIKRNVVILPKGYELTGSASPAMVSMDADGRIRVSFLNDRDDQLPVKITGRKRP